MNFADTINTWGDITSDWASEEPIDATRAYIGLAKAYFERLLDPASDTGSVQQMKEIAEGTFAIEDRGTYTVGKYYNEGDVVEYNGDYYISNVSHTAETFRTTRTFLNFMVEPFELDQGSGLVYEDTFENIKVNTFNNTITADLINSGTTDVEVTAFWLKSAATPFSYDEDMIDIFIYAKRPYTQTNLPAVKDILTPLYYEDSHTVSGNFELYPMESVTIYGESVWHKSEAFGVINNDSSFISLESQIRNLWSKFVETEYETTTNRIFLNEVERNERINSLYTQLRNMKYHKAPLIWDLAQPSDDYTNPSMSDIRGNSSYDFTLTPTSGFELLLENGGYSIRYLEEYLYLEQYGVLRPIGPLPFGTLISATVVKVDQRTTVTINSFDPVVAYTPFIFNMPSTSNSYAGGTLTISNEIFSVWNNPATTNVREIRQVYSWLNETWYFEGQNRPIFSNQSADPNDISNTRQLDTTIHPSVTYTTPIFPKDAIVYMRQVIVIAAKGEDKAVVQNASVPYAVSAGTKLEITIEGFSDEDVWNAGNWYRYEYYEFEHYEYVKDFEPDARSLPYSMHFTQDNIPIGQTVGELPNYLGNTDKFFATDGNEYLRVTPETAVLTISGLQFTQGVDCKYSALGTFQQQIRVRNKATDNYYEQSLKFTVHPGPIREEINLSFTQDGLYSTDENPLGYWDCLLFHRQIDGIQLENYSTSGAHTSDFTGQTHASNYELAPDYNGWVKVSNFWVPDIQDRISAGIYIEGDRANRIQNQQNRLIFSKAMSAEITQRAVLTDIWGNKHFGELVINSKGVRTGNPGSKASFYANYPKVADMDITWDGPAPEFYHYGVWMEGGAGTMVAPAQVVETVVGTPGQDTYSIDRSSYLEYVDVVAKYSYEFDVRTSTYTYSNQTFVSRYRYKDKYWYSGIDIPHVNPGFDEQKWFYNYYYFNRGFSPGPYSGYGSGGNPSAGQGGSKKRLGMHPLFPSSTTGEFRYNPSLNDKDYGVMTLDISERYNTPPDIFEDVYEIPFTAGSISYVPNNLGSDALSQTQVMGRLVWNGQRNWTVFRLTNVGSNSQKYSGIVYAYGSADTNPTPSQSQNKGSAGIQITTEAPSVTIVAQVFNHLSTDSSANAKVSQSTITVSRPANPSYSFTGNKQPMIRLSARLISVYDPLIPPLTLNLFGEVLNLPFESSLVQDTNTGGDIYIGAGPDFLAISNSEYSSFTNAQISQIASPSSEPINDYIKNQKINQKDGYIQFWDAREREEYWSFQNSPNPLYQIEIYQDSSGDYASWQEAYDDLINFYTIDPTEPSAIMVWDKANLYEITWKVQDEQL